MIIELFGLPGSGKSTIIRSLVNNKIGKDIFIRNRFEKAFYLSLFLMRHPIISFFWIKEIILQRHRELTSYKISLLFSTFAKIQKASFSNNTYIIDEGLIQRILSIYETNLTEQKIKSILNYVVISDKILFIKGGLFDRFVFDHDKNNSPRFKMGEKYMKDWSVILTNNIMLVNTEIMKIYNTVYRSYDNSKRLPLVLDDLI